MYTYPRCCDAASAGLHVVSVVLLADLPGMAMPVPTVPDTHMRGGATKSNGNLRPLNVCRYQPANDPCAT